MLTAQFPLPQYGGSISRSQLEQSPVTKEKGEAYPSCMIFEREVFLGQVTQAIKESGESMRTVSERAGKSESFVKDFFKKKTTPKIENYIALCNALDKPLDYFLIGKKQKTPIIGTVPGGMWLEPIEIPECDRVYIDFPRANEGRFALKVVGDSMDKVAPEGSIIVVDKIKTIGNARDYNDRMVVCFNDGEATFKRYNHDAHVLEPLSHNPTWRVQPVKTDFVLLAVVIAVFQDYPNGEYKR